MDNSVLKRRPVDADGCDKCRFGIAKAPPLTRGCDLYLERLVQALVLGSSMFCDCRAGKGYRSFLRKTHKRLMSEAAEQADRSTYWQIWHNEGKHPEIERAMRAVWGQDGTPPRVRFIQEGINYGDGNLPADQDGDGTGPGEEGTGSIESQEDTGDSGPPSRE